MPGTSRAQSDATGANWCTTNAMGFEVVSDLEPQALGNLLNTLNRFELWATQRMPGSATTNRVPMRMLIFSSNAVFRDYFGNPKFSGFLQPSLATSTLVIAPQRGNQALRQTALHEYSHYLLRNRLDLSLPLWFDEGLASLLATVEFDDDTAVLGRLPLTAMRELTSNSRRVLSLRQALETDYILDWPRKRIDAFYYWSWLTVHYLMLGGDEQRQALEDYLQQRRAPLVSYLNTGYRRLETRLRRYVTHTVPEVSEAAPRPARLDIAVTCLNPLQRDLFLGAAIVENNPDRTLQLAVQQAAEHPQDARLLVLQAKAYAAKDDPVRALDLAQQAYALAPDNAAVLVNLGDRMVHDCLLRQGPECRQKWRQALPLYQRSLQLDSNRIDAVFGIGLSNLHAGRPGEAVNYLKVAYSRTPWAVHVNFFLGESYRVIGDTRARGYLENARNWSQNEVWRRLSELALQQLDN